jgi:D-alanine transaminase
VSDIVFLNGAFVARDRALVPVDDRGFLFGDGVYEVVRLVAGRYVDGDRHRDRLARSLAELRLEGGIEDGTALLDIGLDLLARNRIGVGGQALVYLQVTRGVARRRHAFPPAGTPPTVFVAASGFVPQRDLMETGVAAVTHPDLRWHRCDIKSVNLLPNVLANQKATEQGAYEAILVRDGVVTEGTRSNVFAVVDGVLRTHPTGPAILPGVTRAVVVELAREAGLHVEERAFSAAELAKAAEVFATGTTTDVTPVVAVDGRAVGSGQPGPVARRLGALLTARMTSLPD